MMIEDKRGPVKGTRNVPWKTRLLLYVRAGGRCEFDGCNRYLLEHHATESPGNFGEQAHIYAFAESGPRGAEPDRPSEINSIENLVLLCAQCHHLVDAIEPESYSAAALKAFKQDHEDRIFSLTELSKDRATVPLVIRGLIHGRSVDISDEEMQAAVAPSYLRRRHRIDIDLRNLRDTPSEDYWGVCAAEIDRRVARLTDSEPESRRSLRISVFGLAAIPLLIHLGSRLSDKVTVDLYQRHRGEESWKWQTGLGRARFAHRLLSRGRAGEAVALLVNVSGRNSVDDVHRALTPGTEVFELTLEEEDPSPLILRTREDLSRFTEAYIRLLSRIRAAHPHLEAIQVFPAVPAPVAITLGRVRLPKVDPALVIWDRDVRAGGFTKTLEVK